jgi:predicted AAA+ superfamily ATPase
MIKRNLSLNLKLLAEQYPVVTVTGPRQSGKTTLVKSIFPDYGFISISTLPEDVRRAIRSDPEPFSTGQ